MDAAAGPPRFTVPALARFLLAPDAGEQLSPVGGDGATGPAGLVLQRRHQQAGEAVAAMAGMHHQLADFRAVRLVRHRRRDQHLVQEEVAPHHHLPEPRFQLACMCRKQTLAPGHGETMPTRNTTREQNHRQ